jgi:predicted ArsR family transcriptional regulator
MDVSQPSADVLAQPTRARLLELLAELRRPAATQELAQHLTLHPNGVRAHLELLHAAGLVERRRSQNRRGRPRDEWTVAADALPGGQRPEATRDLVRWLARAIPAMPSRLRDVESAGREIGRDIAPRRDGPTADALRDALAALGFHPDVRVDGRRGTVSCTLGNCPYRDAVRENQPVVCALHRGITRGMLDVIDPQATLASFTPQDPDQAGCVIEVTGAGP